MSDSKKKNQERYGVILSKLSEYMLAISAVIAAIMLILIGTEDNVEITRSRSDFGYMAVENYTCTEIEDDSTPADVKKEYTFNLSDEINSDTCLAFYTVHQYVEVSIDGQMVYSMKPSEGKHLSKTVGSNWTMIPIYREDAGKEVQIIIIPAYESFRDRKVDFLIGSPLAIYRDRFFSDLPQLLLGTMAMFAGLIFICVAGYNMVRKKRGKSLVALGLFSVMMGIWRLTDTRFTPFLMEEKPVLLFCISIVMLMLGAVPFARWAEGYFSLKGRRVLDGYCIAASLVCLVQTVLQIAGIKDLRETLTITHVVIAVGVFAIMGIAVYETKKYPGKEKLPIGSKLSYLIAAGIILDVLAFYVKGNSSGLIFSLSAFIIYIVTMGIATLYNYSEQEMRLVEQARELAERDRELAEQERKLTRQRISSMMSQIRSHFIFNVLATISTYCKIDPQKADDALICFSRYLRKNIKNIEEEGLIDFSAELEQLEDYVTLEQLRFADMINFEEDIQTSSFQIPPLTVQPLVENAIKHGLVAHGKSGTILLRTVKKDDLIEITVFDDGAGFEPEKNENTDSVGIRNVRYRLENMVGGSLDIKSIPGEGTTVTITIPQEAKNESDLC